jgi:DNA-binding LytR/AlgR family response regulator
MTIPKLLVAEDERPQREALVSLLAELWPEARISAVCEDGLSALHAMGREIPDVAFLDIRMPGVSGLEVARAMGQRVHVVFVTAHDEHAVSAFEHGAVDYLLKPVERARLGATITRVQGRLGTPPAELADLLSHLLRAPAAPARPELKWITASLGETVRMYALDDVLAFQAQDKYTRVITSTDDAIIRTSLRELLAALDPDAFWQIHRSVVVRAAAIDHVRRDADGKHWLALRGRRETFPVSSSYQARFRGM